VSCRRSACISLSCVTTSTTNSAVSHQRIVVFVLVRLFRLETNFSLRLILILVASRVLDWSLMMMNCDESVVMLDKITMTMTMTILMKLTMLTIDDNDELLVVSALVSILCKCRPLASAFVLSIERLVLAETGSQQLVNHFFRRF
jgi:hypothetical protein